MLGSLFSWDTCGVCPVVNVFVFSEAQNGCKMSAHMEDELQKAGAAKFRNLAIIAHVDHGKTTLVDQLLKAGGTYRENQEVQERALDSMDLEREKGITIKAKNTSIRWNGYTINIVDTPGHADFGAEVERVMKMVDGVILVVDAYEGPQAQTRFVLRKALEEGLLPIVVINKIDRPHADPVAVHDQVLELLMDLDATEEQFDAPFVYGSAKDGYFMNSLENEPPVDCSPLLFRIIERIPPPKEADPTRSFKMLISNIDWDDYVGRVAVGRISCGTVRKGDTLYLLRPDSSQVQAKVTRLFEYSGLQTNDSAVGEAGNIIGLSGFEDADIGETLVADPEDSPLPFVNIEPPTVQMEFSINDGPLGGKDGKNVTSRVIRDRLMREQRTNISVKVEDTDQAGIFRVSARGTMQVAILVEQMRREGYELLISRPQVITREIDGKKMEPFETLFIEVPDDCVNGAVRILGNRRGVLESMENKGAGRTFITATIPTRGLIGFEFELVNLTSGHGIFSHLFKEYAPLAGEIVTRRSGTLVSMENGIARPYALEAMEERGSLFISPGDEVYEGMIVGETPKPVDIPVNPTREKHLTNHRSANKNESIQLTPPRIFSLERAIEYIEPDELVEATPHFIRLRKRITDATARKRASFQNSAS